MIPAVAHGPMTMPGPGLFDDFSDVESDENHLPVPDETDDAEQALDDITADEVEDAPLAAADVEDSFVEYELPPNKAIVTFKYDNGRFESDAKGVKYVPDEQPVKKGEEQEANAVKKKESAILLCSPLRVVAKTRDAQSDDWGRLLEWKDDDGVQHRWAMPLELLEGKKTEVWCKLASEGLHIGPSSRAHALLAVYLNKCPVDRRVRCVDRLGWHDDVYVTPTNAVGDPDNGTVFQNAHAIEPAFTVSETVEAWRDSVARLAEGNSRLVFAISVAFAGVLASLIEENSGGFHLRGKSSSGKSTALKAAASVWGRPEEVVRHWRATTNGLEGLAALHNDNILILDELSQCNPNDVGEAAYLLANGQGKTRANRHGGARVSQRWRVMFLSAGEESPSAVMAKVGKKTNVGQEVRLADIEADAGAGWGLVEKLHDFAAPAALIHAIKDAAERCYGAVGQSWLDDVVRDQRMLKTLVKDRVRDFVNEHPLKITSGQAERVARRFGLVAIAGELATYYGLTGWPKGEAERASRACFSAWLESFGGDGNREERKILEQVRAFFEAHGNSRFEVDIDDKKRKPTTPEPLRVFNRVGFRRTGEDGAVDFRVLPESFKNEICDGLDPKAVERLLVQTGWIEKGGDGRAKQKVRLPGFKDTTWAYIFTSKMWEANE
jgi:putative DNA primase/helicase